jgi:hypothetical protein
MSAAAKSCASAKLRRRPSQARVASERIEIEIAHDRPVGAFQPPNGRQDVRIHIERVGDHGERGGMLRLGGQAVIDPGVGRRALQVDPDGPDELGLAGIPLENAWIRLQPVHHGRHDRLVADMLKQARLEISRPDLERLAFDFLRQRAGAQHDHRQPHSSRSLIMDAPPVMNPIPQAVKSLP